MPRMGIIDGRYCAHAALQTDSLLADLRKKTQYGELLLAAKQCEAEFLSERVRVSNLPSH